MYEKDPFASDSDSEQGAADEQNARQQSSGPEAVAQVPKVGLSSSRTRRAHI